MSDERDRLSVILADMDIPAMRRDLTQDANLRWLSRNLAINNGGHPLLHEAESLIRALT